MIAIALRVPAPIYVEEKVFELAAVIRTDNGQLEPVNQTEESEPPGAPLTEEELNRLKPYNDAFKDIDLEP